MKDNTKELREKFENAKEKLVLNEDKLYLKGEPYEDKENRFLWEYIGEYGILRIEDKEDFHLDGNGVILYTDTYGIHKGFEYQGTGAHQSIRSFLRIVGCKKVTIENLTIVMPNDKEGSKKGFNTYDPFYAFEHGIDVQESENILFKNVKVINAPGDGFYVREEKNKNISFVDCTVEGNGRQGLAIVGGSNFYIDNLTVTNSRRGAIDLEPNDSKKKISNVIIKNCNLRSHLLPFPMGGQGNIENVLIENNKYTTGQATTMCKSPLRNSRRNIIFRGNERLYPIGSPRAPYEFTNAVNVLIENEICPIREGRNGKIIWLNSCKNVVIKNNDFPNAKYICLWNTPESEVKVYGNKQKLKFLTPENGLDYYQNNIIGDITEIEEYDVDKYGEPEVPKDPDFEPYMGFDTVEPEPEPEQPPVIEPEEPTEETPEIPDVEPNPTPEQPINKTGKPFYKKTWFIAVAIAAILVLIALIFT